MKSNVRPKARMNRPPQMTIEKSRPVLGSEPVVAGTVGIVGVDELPPPGSVGASLCDLVVAVVDTVLAG